MNTLKRQNHGDYQKHIDGLRAIAVGAVIFFHLFPNLLKGGFIGVDVFFVISGFLITGQIRQQLATDQFSLASFYARRVRRIAPALLTMLLLSTVAAFLTLKPEDMHSFAKSLLAQALSIQNFSFLAEGEYFRGADTKPLLHTWSLAVEEQFYLFWPLLLLSLRRLRTGPALSAIGLLIVGSFAMNNLLISLSPKSSFFLLPTRAWELGLGGVVAIMQEQRQAPWQLRPPAAAWVGNLGFLLVVFSLLFIDASMAFPGYVALFPVVGTALLLLYGNVQGARLHTLLTPRALVATGQISYPLYLWHWPVLVYMHHLTISTTTMVGMAGFFLLTVGLAWLSNRWIEEPIRHRRWLSETRHLCWAVAACFAALAFVAVHVLQSSGAAYRFDARARPYLSAGFDAQNDRCGFLFRILHPKAELCELTVSPVGAPVMLWGNSHADMWSGALADIARARGTTLLLNAKNCRGTEDSPFCGLAVQSRILEEMSQRNVKDVILASTWHTSYGIADAVFEAKLSDLIDRLSALGVTIWVVVDVPVGQQLDPMTAYRLNPAHPKPGTIAYAQHRPQRDRELNLFERLQTRHSNVRIIDVTDTFCDMLACTAGRNGEVWYRDNGHLTNTGARAAVQAFEGIFKK